ncbi:TetR/AcrR family transcriptional regulator [Paenibacillus pini]|uniref:Transcriptional regulator n=1 Tax=Paenibacillus pini JCM 16418 TaxID=1236976 RepID=W7YP06_9BACL|nr:TetR/AcrR family transcriptional regulator [Paenibacillus pini]GAF10157.1 transcriptional regulator [Paenibacillus pini JCM 16418]
MNAKQTLLDIALRHFAQNGYEGASLQHIADEAGIKKPSIYAHYKGKDDLFIKALKHALKEEQRRIVRYVARHRHLDLQICLKGLLQYMQEEYTQNAETSFLLRMSYFPPSSLYNEVMELIYPFLEQMERRMTRLLEEAATAKIIPLPRPREAAVAFMTLVDGILIEMVYGEHGRSQKRLDASWPIYWAGIQHVEITTQ